MNPDVWGALPHDLAAVSAYNLGKYDIAINHNLIAMQLDSDNLRLIENQKFYEEARLKE